MQKVSPVPGKNGETYSFLHDIIKMLCSIEHKTEVKQHGTDMLRGKTP